MNHRSLKKRESEKTSVRNPATKTVFHITVCDPGFDFGDQLGIIDHVELTPRNDFPACIWIAPSWRSPVQLLANLQISRPLNLWYSPAIRRKHRNECVVKRVCSAFGPLPTRHFMGQECRHERN